MNEKLYNEIFEIIIELYDGLGIDNDDDFNDFLNDRTYDVIKEIYNELEVLLKTIYRKNNDDCQEKYMESVYDEVYNAHKERFESMNCFAKYKNYTNTNAMPAFCRDLQIK